MATSLGLASRGAADPTMVLSRARRERGAKLGVALALFGVALVSGLAIGAVALFPEQLARGHSAVVERLNAGPVADEAAAAPAPASEAPPAPVSEVAAAIESATKPAPEPPAIAPPAVVEPKAAAMPTVSPDALPPAPAVAGRAVAAAPPPEEIAPTMTRVVLPSYAKGHRVFVDGRVVGEGAEPITVSCGKRKIQIGSRGRPRARNLPCGGELTLD
ncbi:MAG: hypothetical protein KF850_06705 [Labilithrix sp.]|nr:hypothetical protein [Labilithrix sp.]